MLRTNAQKHAVFMLSLALFGCGSSSQETTGTFTAEPASSSGPLASMALPTPGGDSGGQSRSFNSDALKGLGCGWIAASDADNANIAYPDKAARYWVALIPMTPGNRLRIDGVYPNARYFSFNSYDVALRPTDAIADRELTPQAVSRNPFTDRQAKHGGLYTAYLEFGAAPEQRAANRFYSGSVGTGPAQIPNGLLVPIIYRTYLASDERQAGDVALPALTLETTSGQAIGNLPTCSEPFLPTGGSLFPKSGLNTLINEADYPNALALPSPTAVYPPVTRPFYGLAEVGVNIVKDQTGLSQRESPLPEAPALGGGGFLSNIHNDYTTTGFARRYGSLFLLRAKAPTFRSQSGISFGQEQMRYWSICQNEFATQRYTDCSADTDTVLDAEGYFTVVVSDTAERPRFATRSHGMTWLPWGAYPDGLLLYRQMLVRDDFTKAIKRVPKGTNIQEVMGEYAPQATYCRPEIFDQPNLTPKQRFTACLTDQTDNPAVATPRPPIP